MLIVCLRHNLACFDCVELLQSGQLLNVHLVALPACQQLVSLKTHKHLLIIQSFRCRRWHPILVVQHLTACPCSTQRRQLLKMPASNQLVESSIRLALQLMQFLTRVKFTLEETADIMQYIAHLTADGHTIILGQGVRPLSFNQKRYELRCIDASVAYHSLLKGSSIHTSFHFRISCEP